MLIEHIQTPLKRACITDATDLAFPSIVPTATEPRRSSTKHVIEWGGGDVQGRVLFLPFATDDFTLEAEIRVYGWRCGPATSATPVTVWVPTLLAHVVGTTATGLVGVASTMLPTGTFLCDTITLSHGGTSAVEVVSGTGIPAHVVAQIKGFQKLEFTFQNNSTVAANALYSLLSPA